MRRYRGVILALAGLAALAGWERVHGFEERIRGVLEKTVKPGACAQISDALNEVYYVIKTPAAQQLCAPLLGRRVLLAGVVEERSGGKDYYLRLKKAERYRPRLPSAVKPIEPSTEASVPLPPPPPRKTILPKTPRKLPNVAPGKDKSPATHKPGPPKSGLHPRGTGKK